MPGKKKWRRCFSRQSSPNLPPPTRLASNDSVAFDSSANTSASLTSSSLAARNAFAINDSGAATTKTASNESINSDEFDRENGEKSVRDEIAWFFSEGSFDDFSLFGGGDGCGEMQSAAAQTPNEKTPLLKSKIKKKRLGGCAIQ